MKMNFFKKWFWLVLLLAPGVAWAQTAAEKARCTALKAQFFHIFDSLPDYYCSASALLVHAISLLITFAGIVAVVFIIIGGFWFLTSAGNEETAEKGRKTLVNAVIGLVVIILAGTIVRIIANTLTLGK